MIEESGKSWKDLCRAVIQATDSNEVLKLVKELNQVLESEEQAGWNRGNGRAVRATEGTPCS